ncbi:hypothetical protein [Mycobacterium sp. 1081908.1]|uniref:hypothetical protein n=1 Tax=Mycobacterium sp. 1081908.1 TaxID=1834066 RepID=UPI0007FB719D|nr:hypothetical protein [Mycobacterium sp. 1081908.1]OBK47036.1 hypothetical protein A5655_08625 [Mycobacterium sp. 1081908.1]
MADPFPFLRQVVANPMSYGQAIATVFQTGDFRPVTSIPGRIAQYLANVVGTLTNTNTTSSLVQSLTVPTDVTLDNAVGLPSAFATSVMGPPAAALDAAGYSAPAIIANGFLNGQATFPYALSLSCLTGAAIGNIADVTVVAGFPLDGILHPPGYYPVTATVTLAGNAVL